MTTERSSFSNETSSRDNVYLIYTKQVEETDSSKKGPSVLCLEFVLVYLSTVHTLLLKRKCCVLFCSAVYYCVV